MSTADTQFSGASRAADYVEDEPSEVPANPTSQRVRPIVSASAGERSTASLAPAAEVIVRGGVGDAVDRHVDKGPARSGLRGWLNGMGMKLEPSRGEWDQRVAAGELKRAELTIRRTVWTRAVGVLVANRKGNAGKTPTSIALGGVLSSIRGGSVAVMEVSDDRGQLFYRAEGSPILGMGELIRNIDSITNQGQLKGYTAPQESFASVIGTRGFRPAMTEQNVVDVSRVIDVYFDIRVMDSGNQYTSSAFTGAVRTADVLVIPTMNSADSIFDALDLIDYLRNSADPHDRMLAATAIVVRLSDGRPEVENAQVLSYFHDQGVGDDRIFTVPFDAHIADRDEINVHSLEAATREAFTLMGAATIEQVTRNVTEA